MMARGESNLFVLRTKPDSTKTANPDPLLKRITNSSGKGAVPYKQLIPKVKGNKFYQLKKTIKIMDAMFYSQ